MFFSKQNILLDQNLKNQTALFEKIAKIAKEKNLAKSKNKLVNSLLDREKVGTTGFEDGFAIPHARSAVVKKATVFIVRNQFNFRNWDSLDKKGVKIAIVLLIPPRANANHVTILAAFAQKLINKSFRQSLKLGSTEKIYELISNLLANIKAKTLPIAKSDQTKQLQDKSRKLLVGISACPAGIAHTFMVKEKMQQLAKVHNLNLKWETQGANGHQNILTKDDIKKASYIIIASDIEIDLRRFKGIKFYRTTTNDVIKNSKKVFEKTKQNVELPITKIKNYKLIAQNLIIAFKSSFGKPWTYFSITATLLGITSLIGFSIYGELWRSNPATQNLQLFQMQQLASIALYFAMPLVAASMAKQLTKRQEALYIVFLATIILNIPLFGQTFNSINGFETSKNLNYNIFYNWGGTFSNYQMQFGGNIIGCLTILFLITSTFVLIEKTKIKLTKHRSQVLKFIGNNFSPWISITLPTAIALFLIVFLLGAPLSFLSSKLVYIIIIFPNDYWWLRFIIGAIFGTLIAWDLGQTVNKITLISLIGFAQYDLRLGSIIAVAIPAASFGLGVTFYFYENRFKEVDRKEVAKSFKRGLNGMSEGPLLLTNKYGIRVKITNLIATSVASGLVYMLGIYIFKGGLSGILIMGAQGHLATSNDISFINDILPLGKGIITFLVAIIYGVITYYLVMLTGMITYVLIAKITFSIKSKDKMIWYKK